MEKYLIRFEGSKRISTILIDNEQDAINKAQQAGVWAQGNPLRTYMLSNDGRANVALVDGKIVEIAPTEPEKRPVIEKPEMSLPSAIEKIGKILDVLKERGVIG